MGPNINQIMVPIEEFPVILEDEYIYRAAEVMVSIYSKKDSTWRGYESLHVVDSNKTSVGLLTLRNILKAVHNGGSPGKAPKKLYLSAIRAAASPPVRVKDIMRHLNKDYVEINDRVDSVIKVFMQKNLNCVPVRSGRDLVGMIRAIDLFWFIGDIL